MSAFSYIAAVFGIALGVMLTLQINRLVQSRPGGNLNDADYSGATTYYSNRTKGLEYKSHNTPADATLDSLQREKAALQSRLQEIEERISRMSHIYSQAEHSRYGNRKDVDKAATTVTSSSSQCPYDFKVYVYEIPDQIDALRISVEARRNKTLHVCHKCILEQFSLEYIINDFFMHFCGRTHNPQEADYFYLPLVRDAEFRHAMSISTRNRAPSSAEWALLNLLEKNDSTLWKSVFNITDAYWHAHRGADHIIAMPAPVTNIRHEVSQRGFFHYMMHLHPPIFLCLEYSLGFVQEYPICATQKNIVVPYPTIDPELFSGKLHRHAATVERKYLLYYAGGMHGDCVEVRRAMKFIMQNSTKLHNIIPPVKSNMAVRENGFMAATFCPIPIGDSPSSKRMYDVLNFGCIPVVLSDDLIWAYSDQSGGPLNHSDFSIQIPQSVVHFTAQKTLARYSGNKVAMGVLPVSKQLLYDILATAMATGGEFQQGVFVNPLVLILQRIPTADVAYLQAGVQRAAPFYRFYAIRDVMPQIPLETHLLPDGGAIEVLAQELSKRKHHGLGVLHAQCQHERRQKHKYIRNFACDGRDKVDSLVRRRLLR